MCFKRQPLAILALSVCLSVLLLSGCSQSNSTPPSSSTPSNKMTAPTDDNKSITDNDQNNVANDNQTNRSDNNDADNLSAEAEKVADAIVDGVEQVEAAHVLISEHMAYAAIKIKSTADTDEAEAIKKDVIAKAKAANSELTDVYVSEEADTFTRLETIAADIANGKPLSGFAEELENMFVRVVPSK